MHYISLSITLPRVFPDYQACLGRCVSCSDVPLALPQDEDISRTLDKAIEAARDMKRTTERMAKSLSADLAKAELQRKLRVL